MSRRGRKRRKTRTHIGAKIGEEKIYNELSSTLKSSTPKKNINNSIEGLPKTFVFKHPIHNCGPNINHLITDLRNVMMPLTANRLKEKRKSTLKDYIQVSGPLGKIIFISKHFTIVFLILLHI